MSGATPTTFRFTGQREETGIGDLYFYGSRWYDNAVGRFLSPDTIVPGAGNPQKLNRYSYVSNDPIGRTDPDGHCDGEISDIPDAECASVVGIPGASGNGPDSNPPPGTDDATVLANSAQDDSSTKDGSAQKLTIGRPDGGTGKNYDSKNGQGIYVLRNDQGDVVYVGRGDAPSRLLDHALDPTKAGLTPEIIANNNLTYDEARGVEQNLINQYGLGKDGGQLVNGINGIAPSNGNLDTYLGQAEWLMNRLFSILGIPADGDT